MADYEPDNKGSITGREQTRHHYIQTRSVVHPVSYTMRIGVCFPGHLVEKSGTRALKIPTNLHGVPLKHRDNCLSPEETLLPKRAVHLYG
jgi:hypothetical protein